MMDIVRVEFNIGDRVQYSDYEGIVIYRTKVYYEILWENNYYARYDSPSELAIYKLEE